MRVMDTQTTFEMTLSLHSNQQCQLLCSVQFSNKKALYIIQDQLFSYSNKPETEEKAAL